MVNSHNHSDYSDKMQKCQDYIHALQEEHKKIQVFQRELPLCLELVTQAIEACKQQLSGTTRKYNLHGESECSEQISSEGRIFEEFIPIKKALSNSGEDEEKSQKPNNKNSKNVNEKSSKKSDWLRSVGLWNQTPDPTPEEDLPKRESSGAFHQFKREKSVGTERTTAQEAMNRSAAPPAVTAAAANSTAEKVGGSKKEGQSERKARRTWSPEMHKRFLQALEQLGGSHVATPKQIREFMKVDGLTNDEVKSHLQKYRLHTRSPNHSIHNNNNPQPPQFVVVGGIWVPPPEYATMATTSASEEASGVFATSNRIYAPIATLPPPFLGTSTSPKRKQQYKQARTDDRGNHSEGGCSLSFPGRFLFHSYYQYVADSLIFL